MNMHFDIQVLRTKLLAMARLTHGAVDRSLKATLSGREDMRGAVRNDNQEMSAIRNWIARHEHALVTAAQTDAAHARFVSAALRMSKGLEAAYAAALEIAQENQVRTVTVTAPNAKEPDTGIHSDEFADDRVTDLQMRVCELLFKNQRLRMALMAEGEERRHELV
jgi:hypothetical protein